MTVGMRPAGLLLCPWQPPGEVHEVVWVAAAFGPKDTTEYFRCKTCPRALVVRDGVISSTPGPEVVIAMNGPRRRV